MKDFTETICRMMEDLVVLAEDVERTSKKRYGKDLREIAGQLENIGYELKERK